MSCSIKSIDTDSLSFYRTHHWFERYGEFFTLEDFVQYYGWAEENKVKMYILGNGSNTLFKSQKVRSLILKNKLAESMKPLDEGKFEISSSSLVIDVLKHCYSESLESFYYLASVPATVGGALAMNAGRGRQQGMTIYDFVESVTFFDFEENLIKTLSPDEIVKGYRQTIFTGIQNKLILSAVFKFKTISFSQNPVSERRKWSKEFQDYSSPNCGSVFKLADYRILRKLQGLSAGKSSFSKKTTNWIVNRSESSSSIRILIAIAKALHFLLHKKSELEVIVVE